MKKKSLLFLGAICILLLSSSIASAQIKMATIGPSEFVSEIHSANQIRSWVWGRYLYMEPTATHRWINARVDLPAGAVIKWVKVHYYDNIVGPYIIVDLWRGNKYDGSANKIYSVQCSGSNSTAIRTRVDLTPSAGAHALVNLGVFNYYLMVDMSGDGTFPGSELRLYGVTIGYE